MTRNTAFAVAVVVLFGYAAACHGEFCPTWAVDSRCTEFDVHIVSHC